MSIVKELDKLSGTDTMSRNITQAIDKLADAEKPSRNIMEAIKNLPPKDDEEEQEEEPVKMYVLTADTEVVTGKTYYVRSGEDPNYVYTPVENPSGDPSAQEWYEEVTK